MRAPSTTDPWVIQLATVELRYTDGLSYYDRCGGALSRLLQDLGKPFELQGVPTVDGSLVESGVERLSIRFDHARIAVTQQWPPTAARIQESARAAWKALGDTMGVGKGVTRAGVRFHMLWPVPAIEEGQALLKSSGLVRPTREFESLFGAPHIQSYTGIARRDGDVRLRCSLDTVKLTVAENLPRDLDGRVPDRALRADLDYIRGGEDDGRFSLGHGQLSDFIRSSYEDMKVVVNALAERFAKGGAND